MTQILSIPCTIKKKKKTGISTLKIFSNPLFNHCNKKKNK